MRKILWSSVLIILSISLAAQTTGPREKTAKTIFEGQPATLRLALHLTTTIRLPDPVNSVVVGDSSLFQAEYSPDEPLLVFAKPLTATAAESNLVISTTHGRHFVLSLKSPGSLSAGVASDVDLFVNCRPAGIVFIEETFPSTLIPGTLDLGNAAIPGLASGTTPESATDRFELDDLVRRQAQQSPNNLYGDRIRVSIGQVLEHGARLTVSFTVINSGSETVELVPPQVQLAGQTKSAMFRHTRWDTVHQLPVEAYRFSSRKIEPRGRVDGALTFERPQIKQSTEGLFLQIADSAAIDRPTLAPLSFRSTNLNGEKP